MITYLGLRKNAPTKILNVPQIITRGISVGSKPDENAKIPIGIVLDIPVVITAEMWYQRVLEITYAIV